MNIDGIDSSQIESIRTPFLESQTTETAQVQKAEEKNVETEKIQQLAQQAQELPENRPDVVARGRELLADPNYPSADIEGQVAEILLGETEETF